MTTTARPTSISASEVPSKQGIAAQLRLIGITGLVVALALGVFGWLMASSPGNNGSVGAAIGILFMTLPVALARRWPIPAVAIVAAAAIVNGLVRHDIVRCGAAFPALLYITFAVGARSRAGGGWLWPLVGLALSFVSVAAQRLWDPVLDNEFLMLAIPLVLLCWAAGVAWSALETRRQLRS